MSLQGSYIDEQHNMQQGTMSLGHQQESQMILKETIWFLSLL